MRAIIRLMAGWYAFNSLSQYHYGADFIGHLNIDALRDNQN